MASASFPEDPWIQFVTEAFPDLQTQTHFVPPYHFSQIPSYLGDIEGQTVHVLCDPQQQPPRPKKRGAKCPPPPPPPPAPGASLSLPGAVFTPNTPGLQPPRVQESDVQDDRAQGHTLQCLRVWAERTQQVMVVVSQLQFKKYLNKTTDPVHAAAIAHLPDTQGLPPPLVAGECDVLIVHRTHGLIVCEIKSVGGKPNVPVTPAMIVNKVKRAVTQLNNQYVTLDRLVSDLGVKVTKTIVLPGIRSAQLEQALLTDRVVMQNLFQCLGVQDLSEAVKRCLCIDIMPDDEQLQFHSDTRHLSRWGRLRVAMSRLFRSRRHRGQPGSAVSSALGSSITAMTGWWEEAVVKSANPPLTSDVYLRLVARFVGPASTIDVATVTPARKEIRTLGEAVAETGARLARLALYPDQMDLLNKRLPPWVYISGPPGTGKTILLTLRAIQWLNKGMQVFLLSHRREGHAVTSLIRHQLIESLPPATTQNLHCHCYDFGRNSGDVEAAVKQLTAAAPGCGGLGVVMDEVDLNDIYSGHKFLKFISSLHTALPAVCLWSAGLMDHSVSFLPSWVHGETITLPLRCPPQVTRQVSRCVDLGHHVPAYTSPSMPAVTEGPGVMWLKHSEHPRHYNIQTGRYEPGPLLPGHCGDRPTDCVQCGKVIASRLNDTLHVGQPGCVQYKDVFILGVGVGDNDAMVLELRHQGIPVKVVNRDSASLTDFRDMGLANSDHVIVTDRHTVSGLERRVVIGLGEVMGFSRLYAMSRCTAQLYWFGGPDD